MKSKQTLRIKCTGSIYSKITLNWRCWTLATTLLVLMMCSSVCIASTCPSFIPKTTATTIDQYRISGSSTYPYKVVSSTVSDNLYYLDYISISNSSLHSVVRKINTSGTQFWQDAFEVNPLKRSLSIDAKELSVYFASSDNPVTVFRLDSSNGDIINQHKYE